VQLQLRSANEATGQGACVDTAAPGDFACDDCCIIATRALANAGGAAWQVTNRFGPMEADPIDIDHVEIGAKTRRDPSAIG